MKCPEGMIWIPDREFCSRCPFGYIWNAEWNECVKMAKVAEPGNMPTSGAAFFGVDYTNKNIWFLLGIAALLLKVMSS